jgi:hypothetical protein
MPNGYEQAFANLAKSKAALDVMEWAAEYARLLEQGYDPQYAHALMAAKLMGLLYFPRPVEIVPMPEPGDPLATGARYRALQQVHTYALRFAKEIELELERLESNKNLGIDQL